MLSYHNDPRVKAKYVARMRDHIAKDEVIQGTGFNYGRGCFVGCTLDKYDHSRFPIELGWPEQLARLADVIFEGLPESEAPKFGSDLLAAVPVGKDLSRVCDLVMIKMHERALIRLAGSKELYAEQCCTAIQGVIEFLKVDENEAESSARSAARSAESAAWSAAREGVCAAA